MFDAYSIIEWFYSHYFQVVVCQVPFLTLECLQLRFQLGFAAIRSSFSGGSPPRCLIQEVQPSSYKLRKRSKSVPTRVGKPQSSHLIEKPRQKFFASGPDKLALTF